jgi:hypothetical protein
MEEENTGIPFAEQEFRNYCEANEIDCNEADMSEEDLDGFVKIKKRFIKAVGDKRLVIDGTKLRYTISKFSDAKGKEITVSRPAGREFMAMDGFKDTHQAQKMNAFIASMCGVEKSFLAQLDVKDRLFLQDIAILFLTD